MIKINFGSKKLAKFKYLIIRDERLKVYFQKTQNLRSFIAFISFFIDLIFLQ